MYYRICESGIERIDRKSWESEAFGGIAVIDEEEWGEELEMKEEVFFSKIEQQNTCLFGTFHIPVKKKERKYRKFVLYLLPNRLILIDHEGFAETLIQKMEAATQKKNYSLELFINDFFMYILEDDILYMASLEREITEMEETVLAGQTKYFNYQMLGLKKEISRFYCYYSQMADTSEMLCEKMKSCLLYQERIKRLWQEALSLREYAMQVQEVYQSEINIRQNDIMKLLTVVTTIFLPLTLVAGWYGMNFYNMPEISWEYGYPVVTGISILIVSISLWVFKKKGFF